MIIEKERHYSVILTYQDNDEEEYEVFDFNQNKVGYFVFDYESKVFEVYHSVTEDFDDFTQIDYCDNYDEALYFITSEIYYDFN